MGEQSVNDFLDLFLRKLIILNYFFERFSPCFNVMNSIAMMVKYLGTYQGFFRRDDEWLLATVANWHNNLCQGIPL